mmetsp:Transcript_54071/g.96205  ORF Transcript_54071/g.96205 Transcript_54071/m.96205 type:complete len:132 (-) Transcript_54071:126-521(-)
MQTFLPMNFPFGAPLESAGCWLELGGWVLVGNTQPQFLRNFPQSLMQRVITTACQPTMLKVTQSLNESFKVQDEIVFTAVGCGIPMEKADHLLYRVCLQKYVTMSGCFPRLSSTFPKNHATLWVVEARESV